MNKNMMTLSILICLTTFTGCVSPEEKARRAAAYQAQQEATQAARQQQAKAFREGWSKLQKGMSAQQVSGLLGDGWFMSPASMDESIKLGLPTGFRCGTYEVRFDGNGLASWTLFR
jgi:hypothetical protein